MNERLEKLLKIILRYFDGPLITEDSFPYVSQAKFMEVCRGVAQLSEIYTRQRGCVDRKLLQDPAIRRAYLAYFLPSNLLKIKIILKEIWAHPEVRGLFSRKLRLLDLGSGPGTYLLGFLDFLADAPQSLEEVECVAVDSVSANLEDAAHLFHQYLREIEFAGSSPQFSFHPHQADLTRPLKLSRDEPFDLIVLGNCLNELFLEKSDRIEKRCEMILLLTSRWLAPHGFLILIEPALKETSRDLLLLRDRLLDHSDFKVYSPCVHSNHCPAVSAGNLSDWCHEEADWSPPTLVREIDRRVGNHKSSLKYSYCVLNRKGLSVMDAALFQGPQLSQSNPGKLQLWRVVSERLEEKGKSQVYFCGSPGRTKVTRLNRHANEANLDFDKSARGQVVATENLKVMNPKDWRVEVDTQVHILREEPHSKV